MKIPELSARLCGTPSRRTKAGAVIGSVVAHVLLLTGMLASASGVISGGARSADFGDAIEVSLAGMEGAASAPASPPPSAMRELFERIRADQSNLYAADQPAIHSDLTQLFEEIDRRQGDADGQTRDAGSAHGDGRTGSGDDRTGQARTRGQAARAPRLGEQGSSDPSSGELWGQIEPCWRKMPQASVVPVTLEVVLNDRGSLAGPPRIVRPHAAKLDDPRLIAEARALSAVAACVPFNTLALPGSRRAFRVDFATSPSPSSP